MRKQPRQRRRCLDFLRTGRDCATHNARLDLEVKPFHTLTAAANTAVGFGSPEPAAHKRPSPDARRFFHARVRRACTTPSSMAGGVREPQGSPVRRPVFQPRTVRHPFGSGWRTPFTYGVPQS